MLNAYCTFRLFLKVSLHSGRVYNPAVCIAVIQHADMRFCVFSQRCKRRGCANFNSAAFAQFIFCFLWCSTAVKQIMKELIKALVYYTVTHEVRGGYPLNLSI